MENPVHKYNRFLFVIIAVAPFISFFTVFFIDMDFNRVLQLLSYIGVFLLFIFNDNKKKPIIFPKYLLYYLLFIVYVFYADLVLLDRPFKPDYLFSNKLIGSFNFMLIVENINIPKKWFERIISISKKVLIIAVVVIIYQQVVDSNFFMNPKFTKVFGHVINESSQGRLFSIYSWLGGIFSSGFGFVPVLIIVIELSEKKKINILPWLILGLIYVFLTKQRWIMLNFALVFLLFLINSKYKAKKILTYALILPVMFFATVKILDSSGVNATEIIEKRILESDKRGVSNTSAGTRILAFYAFNHVFWDNPWTGTGNIKYGMGGTEKTEFKLKQYLRGRSSQIHVGYLSLFYLYGIIGGVIFLTFLYLFLKRMYQTAKKTTYWGPYLAILGFAINNFLDVNFQFLEMGLLLALLANHYYLQNKNQLDNVYA